MKLLWTLAKVAIVLVLAIPVGIILLGTMFGLLGALIGLAFVALRVAIIALAAYGVFRLAAWLLRGRDRAPAPRQQPVRELPPVDPYYSAAMRELDRDLGEPAR